MNRLLAASILTLALLGASPPQTGLVAGSVRDQHGVAIADARIAVYAGGRIVATAVTASDGTFAATADGADVVRVACAYCRLATERVAPDGTVVAIVHRYDALRSDVPTASDLVRLPYSEIESSLSLTPFVLLTRDALSVIGSQLDDRRVSGHGGLVVINGTPNYDIQANASAYVTVPDYDASAIDVLRSSSAYLYGDTADSGTFIVGTLGGAPLLAAGNGVALKAAGGGSAVAATAANSNDGGTDVRSRADARLDSSMPGLQASVAIGTGRGSQTFSNDVPFASSFSSLHAQVERTTGADIAAAVDLDRGTYAYDVVPYPAAVVWSDANARLSIKARSALSPFALVNFRRSTGEARLGQTRLVAGATLDQRRFSAIAALATDAVSYDSYGPTATALQHAHDGIVSATWRPGAVELEASIRNGYWLPVFADAYDVSPGAPVTIDQSNALETTLSYGDGRRLRVAATALRFADRAGTQSGSAGASIVWQIAPNLSVRSWMLRDSDNQFGAAAFGSTWATYQNGSFYVDAILRRDLRAGLPDAHIDAAIGGAFGRRATWFAATERRNGMQSVRAGLRF